MFEITKRSMLILNRFCNAKIGKNRIQFYTNSLAKLEFELSDGLKMVT